MYKRQISRFPELYNPNTHNFQIWLAFLAFTLFILATFFNFTDGRWYMLDKLIVDFPPFWYGVVFAFGFVFGLFATLAFVSLVFITVKSFFKQKVEESITITHNSLNQLTKEIKDIKNAKEMIDKFLRDMDNTENKETTP